MAGGCVASGPRAGLKKRRMYAPLILAAAAPAAAATSGAPPPPVDAIVVTGERVPRTRHETAASLAVIDAATAADQPQLDRVEQLLQLVPNLTLGSGGEGPVIRGQDSTGVVRDLPAFLSGIRPRTTITVDGRSATYYELAFGLTALWDLDRLEVYRSPQTTTQGRNAIGGAIFVATADPTPDWEGRARAVAGDFATRQLSAALSGPVTDGLAFRVAGDVRRSRTASELTSTAAGIDPNRDESQLVRVKLRAQPRDLPGAHIALTYTHGWSQMPQFEGTRLPFEDRRDPVATYGIFAIGVGSLTTQLGYKPGGAVEMRTTASFGRADIRRHAPAGLGEAVILSRDLSIEPLFTWRGAGGLQLTAGLHAARTQLGQAIDLTSLPAVQGTGVFSDWQTSLGLFGEATAPIGRGFSVTAGLRRQHDRQLRRGTLTGRRLLVPVDYDRSFVAWLPKLSFAWDISDELRTGVLVQRAANPGGLNLNIAEGNIDRFEDEALWAYEAFARLRLLRLGLAIAGNAFHYAMTDAQRTQTLAIPLPGGGEATGSKVGNAPRAWSRGLELEADWRPGPSLALRGAVGLLDTRISATRLASDPLLGKRFQRSPALTASAGAAWSPAPGIRLSGTVRHTSSYFSDDLETAGRRVPPATVVDAKASWRWQALTFSAYARNLFDRFYLTYLFTPASRLATAGDPRELGVAVEARF